MTVDKPTPNAAIPFCPPRAVFPSNVRFLGRLSTSAAFFLKPIPELPTTRNFPVLTAFGGFPYIFPSLSEISVPQRQAGFKQTAIPRHSAPTAAEREAKAANNNPLSVPNPLSDSRPKQPIRAGAEYAKSLAYKSYAAARLQPSLKHSRRSSASPPHPPYGRQSKRRCKRFATVPKILPENPPNWHFQNLASFSQIKF